MKSSTIFYFYVNKIKMWVNFEKYKKSQIGKPEAQVNNAYCCMLCINLSINWVLGNKL